MCIDIGFLGRPYKNSDTPAILLVPVACCLFDGVATYFYNKSWLLDSWAKISIHNPWYRWGSTM